MNNNKIEKISENLRKGILLFLAIEVISLSFSIAVSSIAFGTAVILWVTKLIFEKKWIRTPLDIFFLLFICVEVISTIFSINQSQSMINMKRLFIFTVFYMTFHSLKSDKEIKIFFIIFFCLISVLSVIEIIVQHILNIDRIGVFQHYMTTGGIKMIVCLFIIPFLFQKELGSRTRIFLLINFIPVLLTLILTMTRSSWFGLLGGILVFGIIKNKYTLLYLLVFIVLAAFFAPSSIKHRALSSFDPEDGSNKPRINMIKTGWRIFLDYPIIGVGDIDLKKTYIQYTTPIDRDEGGHLHNNFMQILVDFGIIGFTVFVLLFVFLLIYIYKTYLMVKDVPILSSLAIIPMMIFFAFHINGLFEWNFGDQEIAILFWFSMGLSVVARQMYKKMVLKEEFSAD